MTEKTQTTEVPQPVQWAVNVCAQETQRVTKIDSDIAEMDRRIIATQALLDQLVADKDVAMNARVTSAANAALAREMAETVCAAHGWAMPEIPAEAPMHQTSAFPAQNKTEQNGTAHAPVHCQRCTDPLHFEHGNWLDRYGCTYCDAAGENGGPHVPVTLSGAPVDPHPAADQPLPASDPTQVVDLGAIGQGGGDRG